MAINAPIIRPDPTGEYQRAFQTADTSARAYAALALERQKMEADAIQKARENKALDFKMMMMALERPDKLKQEEIANAQKQQQLDIESKRLGISEAQLGLQGFSNQTSRMSAEAAIALAAGKNKKISLSEFMGGGTSLNADESTTTTTGTDQIPADLPSGNGTTSTTLLDGQPPEGTITDLQPGDVYNPPPTTPSSSATTEAPTPSGLKGLADIVGPPLPVPSDVVGPPSPDSLGGEGPLGPKGPEGQPGIPPAAPEKPLQVPSAGTVTSENLLPPPVLTPPVPKTVMAARDEALKASTKRIEDLSIQYEKYNTEAGIAASNAARLSHALNFRDRLTNASEFAAELAKEKERSLRIGFEAKKTEENLKKAKEDQKIVTTRLNALGALKGVDTVLPETDYTELLKTLKDPTTGTLADEQLLKLATYQQIRRGLPGTYKSNGIETANRVAELGAQVNSKDGQKLRADAATVREIDRTIAAEQAKINAMKGDDTESIKGREAIQKTINSYIAAKVNHIAAASQWDELSNAYQIAIEADKRVEAPAKATPMEENKTFWSAMGKGQMGSEPAPALPSEAPENAPWKEFAAKGPNADQAYANAFWNAGKQSASEAGQLAQAPNEVLNDIINRRPPTTGANISLGGRYDVRTAASATPISMTIAERIKKDFKMPEGSNDPRLTGRSANSPPTVEEFLIEAAKAELAKRGVKTTGGGTQPEPAALDPNFDKLRAKYGG